MPLLMALFCIVAWGLSYAAIRITVQEIPPLTLACLRHLVAAGLLWPLVRWRSGRQTIAAGDRWKVFAMGLSGISGYFAFENYGLSLTTASHGALIIAVIPLCTELVIARRKRRLPPTSTWLGTLTALLGVGLLVGLGEGEASLAGDLLMFGAVASWVAYTFLVEGMGNRYPKLLLTRQIMCYGGLTLLPGMLWELCRAPLLNPSPAAWSGLAFLTILCSALGYVFWNTAIPALGPSATNNLLYFLPLVGVLGGVILLGEPLSAAVFCGGGLILAGVLLARAGQTPVPQAVEASHGG
jgi:drug/metabolite transporter (DMT)-like permease